jgi:hypothetical protein
MPVETLRTAIANIRACPFDLPLRAAVALHGCTALTDPLRDGQPFSYAEFHTDPPIALHSPWDYSDSAGRLIEAVIYASIMEGSELAEAAEQYARLLARCQRNDGLIAIPADPWTHTAPVVEMDWTQRAALLAWTARYLALDDHDALDRANRLVHALHRVAVWDGESCWFPASFLPESGWLERTPPQGTMRDILIGGTLVFPLVRFAETTSNEEAMHLAGGLIRFLRERSRAFLPDGSLTPQSGKYLHSDTAFIKGVLKYALVQGDDTLRDWAEAAYRHCRQFATDFGFFPHRLSGRDLWQGDVCSLKDMIEMALLLGHDVHTDYFTDVERFGRNHLLESQILDFEWVRRRIDPGFPSELWCANHPPEGVTTHEVCQRALGAFASWTRINDVFDPANPRLQLRSAASGMRALYALWRCACTREEGAVRVNLHFSRDTRWATVTSYLPTEGKIEVLMKTRGVLAVRVPSHLTEDQVSVSVNLDQPRREILQNGYAWIEALQNGDMVTIRWPLEEQTMLYEYEKAVYTGAWRGDTLMRLESAGQLSPMYRRTEEVRPAPPRLAEGPIREIASL